MDRNKSGLSSIVCAVAHGQMPIAEGRPLLQPACVVVPVVCGALRIAEHMVQTQLYVVEHWA